MARKREATPALSHAGRQERGRIHASVEEIAPALCEFCAALDGRGVKATHRVRVEAWASFLGMSADREFCRAHAEEVARAINAEVVDRRKTT